ncbi:monocarboxylate transporter 13-like [Asterias rubens]|uniref:monocarboxylate transporter 13-like n=1 Tax=Asterias rubens TaxID=7604 RepID=UPI001454EEA5|nr:monocarboxylate transporter 13-like [Asterias rubens]
MGVRAPDHGWAWMVLIGTHFGNMLGYGYLTTLGIFYIEWKEYYDSTATATSWMLSMPWMVASPFCVFIGVIASRIGIRRVAVTGALINGSATILGSLTKDMWQLYMCNALSGFGVVMMLTPGSVILAQYFNKRYALANGIAFLGISNGQMVFPPLFRILIDNYGWRSAMFVTGALQLNGVAACALFRPLKTRAMKMKTNKANSDVKTSGGEDSILPPSLRFLCVFTNIHAVLLLLACCAYSIGLFINLSHLPARAKDAGWSDYHSSMLLFVYAIVSMVTRLGHGWFVDRDYISCYKLHLVTLLGSAVTTALNPVSDSYVFLVGYVVVYGAFTGVASPLFVTNMRKLVDPSHVPVALSLIWATAFIFNGIGSVVAGRIYDATGNYVVPFLAGGAMFLVAFLLTFVIALTKRRQERHSNIQVTTNQVQYDTVVCEL